MDEVEALRWDGEFAVVETDRTWYLGTVRVSDGSLTVYTGMTGRPPVVPLRDVESISAADGHTSVDGLGVGR